MSTFLKVAVGLALGFLAGGVTTLEICSYSSAVWSREQVVRGREALMSSAYDAYRAQRFADAAALVKGANQVARLSDQQWGLSDPLRMSIFRASGKLDQTKTNETYNDFMIAYLYQSAGDTTEAQKFYRLAGTSAAKADASAKTMLDLAVKSTQAVSAEDVGKKQ